MNVVFLTNEQAIEQHMDAAEELLAPVVHQAARGEFELADIRRLALSGRAIVSVAYDDDGRAMMAMAFEFVHYPRRLAVNIMALGGHDIEAVASAWWPTFRTWCESAGADMIEAACSPAMARLLKRLQFTPEYHLVRVTLNQPRSTPC